MPTLVTGVVGKIEWSYFSAAALNGYTVSLVGTQLHLHGTVVASDSFKLSQRPLMFVAPTMYGDLRWPIQEVSIVEGAVTATLGPPV